MGLVAACAGTDSGHSKTVCPASRALKGVSATLGECHNPHDFPTYTKAMKGCFWRQIRGQSALGCAQTSRGSSVDGYILFTYHLDVLAFITQYQCNAVSTNHSLTTSEVHIAVSGCRFKIDVVTHSGDGSTWAGHQTLAILAPKWQANVV
eukprot:6181990-Pleurochrysis_carterae.AAC.1